MKIAIIRQRYTAFGGAERFTDRALKALLDQGAAVSVIARKWSGEGGFPVRECNPFHLGRTWRDWSFRRAVCAIANEYDLVQSHERIPCCDIYRAGDGLHREWLRQKARITGPVHRLGTALSPYHRYVLNAEEALFTSPRLRAVICNSKLIREEIKTHFGLPDERLPVLYNGVDTTTFHPDLHDRHRTAIRTELGVSNDVTVFLFVGSGFLRKGVAGAIAALRHAPESTQLWIIGKDRNLPHYRKLAADLGSRVRFLGPQTDVKPYYGAADALLLPTLYDPFPNVILEAMASGLPVITSLKCGAVDIIEQGINGFVHDALNFAQMGESLRALCDPATAARIGASARNSVADWTLERVADQTLDLYRQLSADAG
ncbi:MAG: glycosyltransferase family 4 protein [Gammaproteobacteria bacterium]|nr:glycosyltransferase family 4 protein [Gammaproteobacteria bacterium]MCP5137515.1 glycosyltransferase family 4 protein [Gammaproteobacteria bacterium]